MFKHFLTSILLPVCKGLAIGSVFTWLMQELPMKWRVAAFAATFTVAFVTVTYMMIRVRQASQRLMDHLLIMDAVQRLSPRELEEKLS